MFGVSCCKCQRAMDGLGGSQEGKSWEEHHENQDMDFAF